MDRITILSSPPEIVHPTGAKRTSIFSAAGPRLPGAGAGRHGRHRPAAPTGQLPGWSNRDCPTARPV